MRIIWKKIPRLEKKKAASRIYARLSSPMGFFLAPEELFQFRANYLPLKGMI